MKKAMLSMMLFILTLGVAAALYAGAATAFTEEEATITKNGADTYGQVFVRTDDPTKLLVLSGDAAFLVNSAAKTVYDVAINSVNDKADPVMIDYGVLSEVEGAGLIQSGGGVFSFLAKGDRYEVTFKSRVLSPL